MNIFERNTDYMRFIILAAILFSTLILKAQKDGPVQWSASLSLISEGVYDVEVKADIEKGWFIYAIDTPDGGPIATAVSLLPSNDFMPENEMYQVTIPNEGYDDLFEMTVRKMTDQALFRQRVKISTPNAVISGEAYFMTCNGQQCLAPKSEPFMTKLQG